MNWKQIAKIKPPANKKLLIAYGYIHDNGEVTISNYGIKVFEEYELLYHLETAINGNFCFFKGDTAIAFWCEIDEPLVNATHNTNSKSDVVESYSNKKVLEMLETVNDIEDAKDLFRENWIE